MTFELELCLRSQIDELTTLIAGIRVLLLPKLVMRAAYRFMLDGSGALAEATNDGIE